MDTPTFSRLSYYASFIWLNIYKAVDFKGPGEGVEESIELQILVEFSIQF